MILQDNPDNSSRLPAVDPPLDFNHMFRILLFGRLLLAHYNFLHKSKIDTPSSTSSPLYVVLVPALQLVPEQV